MSVFTEDRLAHVVSYYNTYGNKGEARMIQTPPGTRVDEGRKVDGSLLVINLQGMHLEDVVEERGYKSLLRV